LLGEDLTYLSPGLGGQFTDELILGTELQVVPDFKRGLNYIHCAMPRVIEDISTDGGNHYMITNPGEDFSGEAAKLREEAGPDGEPLRRARARSHAQPQGRRLLPVRSCSRAAAETLPTRPCRGHSQCKCPRVDEWEVFGDRHRFRTDDDSFLPEAWIVSEV
jgi:hypothetical protein